MINKQTFGLGLLFCFLVGIFAGHPVMATAIQPADATANNYVFQRSWGAEGHIIGSPIAVAVDQDGVIYLVNSGLNRITVIEPGQRIYSNWGGPGTGNGEFSFNDYLP